MNLRRLVQGSKGMYMCLILFGMLVSRTHAQIGIPPQILVQPLGVSVPIGDTATFVVVPLNVGTAVSYQWYQDGHQLANATDPLLIIEKADSGDAGNYTVKLSNSAGSVTSSNATLTVLTPPVITAPPQSQVGATGQNVSFSVAANGARPLAYQWSFNGMPLAGATNSALAFTNVQATNAGNYTVMVTNTMGSVTSAVANLVFQSAPIQYNGSKDDHDYLQATVADVHGNVYVTGYAKEAATGNYDYVTLKYDPAGNQLWRAVYDGGEGDDQAKSLALDSAGYVYVTGASKGNGSGWDYVTVKYDASGNQLWTARFNGTDNKDDNASAIALDGDGNVFVTGSGKNAANHYQYETIKYDSAGNLLWAQTYVGPANSEDDANSLAVDNAGNIYVTGQSKGNGSDFDFATIKYANDGTQLWVVRYNGTDNKADNAVGVAVDTAQCVYVTGSSKGPGSGDDFATVKYGPDGTELWVARYNAPANKNDRPVAIELDLTGSAIVTGSTEVSKGKYDYLTIKYDMLGQQLWVQRYDGPTSDDDQAVALVLDPTGDVYVTGQSKDSGTGYDFATVKYLGTDGAQQWIGRFNSTGNKNDSAVALAVDRQFNVYVGGQAFDKLDYTLVKYQSGLLLPEIITQPQSQEVMQGQSAQFSVKASGTEPLSYQWWFNGAPLDDATGSALSLGEVRTNDSGSYTVVVSNSLCSVTSAVATLKVVVPLEVKIEPQAQTLAVGQSASFSVAVDGTGPFKYQWCINGKWLDAATDSTLTINNAQTTDAGRYLVVVANPWNSVTSAVATLTVVAPPTITSDPQDQTLVAGQSVTFSVGVGGTEPFTYQWLFNDAPLLGATNATLTLNNTLIAYSGSYRVRVANTAGSAPSSGAQLTVTNPPFNLVADGGGMGMTPDEFAVHMTLPVGCTYVVEASSNTRDWSPIATNMALTANVVFTDTAAADHPIRFYRVMVQ